MLGDGLNGGIIEMVGDEVYLNNAISGGKGLPRVLR